MHAKQQHIPRKSTHAEHIKREAANHEGKNSFHKVWGIKYRYSVSFPNR